MKLQGKGFVEINKDQKDNRAIRIKLTQKYYKYSKDRGDIDHKFIEKMFSCLSHEEIVSTCSCLIRLYDGLEKSQYEK